MRLELTRRTELALRAMQTLAGAGDRLKGADLAARIGSTPAYVPQVVAPLVTRGWVTSEPGPLGGYQIAASLDSVTVLDLIEAIEGPTDTGRCVLVGQRCSPDEPCALHEPWTQARGALMAELAATPIAAVNEPSAMRRAT